MAWRYKYILKPAFLLIDLLLIAAAHYAAVYLRFNSFYNANELLPVFLAVASTWLILHPFLKLNHEARFEKRIWRYNIFLFGQLLAVLVLVLYLIFSNRDAVPRLYLAYFIILQFCFLFYFRIVRRGFITDIRKKGYNSKLLYLIGSKSDNETLKNWLEQNPGSGCRYDDSQFINFYKQSGVTDCVSWIQSRFEVSSGEELIIGGVKNEQALMDVVTCAEDYGARVSIVQPLGFGKYSNPSLLKRGPFTVLPLREEPLSRQSNQLIKKTFDLLLSILVMVGIMWWFYPIIGILIKQTGKGPVIIRQDRIGIDGIRFQCMKFRTILTFANQRLW